MRFPPVFAALSCAVLLAGCERKVVDQAEVEKQVQERLAQEHQAQEQQALAQRAAALDAREQELRDREQKAEPTPAPSPAEAVQVNPASVPTAPPDGLQAFYDSLAPYGEWIELPGYGYAWQPADTVHDARWRPYTNGHWAFTDYGWTWVSNEPYGWVTYHYGRWMRTHQLRWVWVPGEQWAPAWVAWRYGNDYVGWAPLPPEAQFNGPAGVQQWSDAQYQLGASDYTFVPASEFGDDRLADAALPPEQNEPVYEGSTNVTDIVYESPSVVFCYGPNYDFICQKSHRLPPRLRLDRIGFGGRNGAFVANGTLQITSPVIRKGPSRTAPGVVRGRFADSRVVTITPQLPPRAVGPASGVHAPAGTPQGVSSYPAGLHYPSHMNPVTVPGVAESHSPATVPSPGNPLPPLPPGTVRFVTAPGSEEASAKPPLSSKRPAAPGLHYPTAMKPVEVPAAVVEQKQRDAQRLEQQADAQRAVVERAQHEQAAAQHAQEAAQQVQETAQRGQEAAQRSQQQQAQQQMLEQRRAAEQVEAGQAAAARVQAARQAEAARQIPAASEATGSPVPVGPGRR